MTLLDTTKERRARYLELLDTDALRAQLAALAEEHEALTVSHDIKTANLELLVEKVLTFGRAQTVGPSDVAYSAEQTMIDLARSLKP